MASIGVMVISVISGSMLPDLEIGEPLTLVSAKYYPLDLLEEGDIISFRAPDPDYELYPLVETHPFIVHRVVEIERNDDGQITEMRTEGDNNNDITIDGIDITEDMERSELLEVYNGIVYEGNRYEEMIEQYEPYLASLPSASEVFSGGLVL